MNDDSSYSLILFFYYYFIALTNKTVHNIIFSRGDEGLMPAVYRGNDREYGNSKLIDRWKRFYRGIFGNNKTS